MAEEKGKAAEDRPSSEEVWKEMHEKIEALSGEMSASITEEELQDLWYRRALELSRSQADEKGESGGLKMITFRLGSDRYGVALDLVREIQRTGRITPVPTAPDFVTGIVNLRGSILSVIDIRVFFGLPAVVINEKTRILVVENKGLRLGILVERVDEITDIDVNGIKPPLSLDKGITEDYIKGIVTHGGDMFIIIDLERILKNPRLIVEEKV
jgi:purine-binding chemotaxis protein CheW